MSEHTDRNLSVFRRERNLALRYRIHICCSVRNLLPVHKRLELATKRTDIFYFGEDIRGSKYAYYIDTASMDCLESHSLTDVDHLN